MFEVVEISSQAADDSLHLGLNRGHLEGRPQGYAHRDAAAAAARRGNMGTGLSHHPVEFVEVSFDPAQQRRQPLLVVAEGW